MTIDLFKAFKFFRANCGYSVPPGRAACALALARAERDARAEGIEFRWEYDPDGASDWRSDLRRDYTDYTPEYVEECRAVSERGKTLASLCGIADADDNYRRVVEAELASEALESLWKRESAGCRSL